jgi:hypothetical protein
VATVASLNWRRCLTVGVVIALVDLLANAVSRGQPPDGEIQVWLFLLDWFANVALFAFLGHRTGLETGRATAAAEAGVLSSLVPALAAVALELNLPRPAGDDLAIPLSERVIAVVAQNIILGGCSAWIAGFLANRTRPTAR